MLPVRVKNVPRVAAAKHSYLRATDCLVKIAVGFAVKLKISLMFGCLFSRPKNRERFLFCMANIMSKLFNKSISTVLSSFHVFYRLESHNVYFTSWF